MIKRRYDILDLTKYVLSFFIVIIHVGIIPEVVYPWVRVAVPLYFIISAFLLFEKINSLEDPLEKRAALIKYVKKNLLFYLFWYVVLLPFTINFVYWSWWNGDVLDFIRKIIVNHLFSSSFLASWFIIGSIYAAILLYLTRKWPKVILIILCVIIYVICVLRSSYFPFIKDNEVVGNVTKYYELVFTNPVFSFPIAFCWMFVGKLFADYRINVLEDKKLLISTIIALVISGGVYFLEWFLVKSKTEILTSDYYFSTPFFVVAIYLVIKDINLNIKYGYILRSISSISFTTHYTLFKLFEYLFNGRMPSYNTLLWVSFVLILLSTHTISFLILFFERFRYTKFLKHSH